MTSRKVAQVPGGGTVFLVDDDASVRRALSRLLRTAGLEVASFPSAEALLEGITATGPACVVADLRMPGLSGLDLQEELSRRGLDLPLLFISGHADVRSSVRAMKSGAIDFLQKPISDAALFEAVGQALARHRERQAARQDTDVLATRFARLTPREREVFALVVSGLLNKQVGYELGATEKTIKVHRARVMEKMEASSLADLVRMAGRLGPAAWKTPMTPRRPSSPEAPR